MKKNGFLDSITIASPCAQDWDAMSGNEKVRFCSHCALEVNNLSALRRKEAMRLVRQSEGRICVRYVKNPETNAPVFAEKLYQITRRAGIAAGVLGASLTLSTLAYAQGEIVSPLPKTPTETSVENQTDKDKSESVKGKLTGKITDETGALITGAIVFLSNEKTNETRNVSVDKDGLYEFENIVPGTYKLKANAGDVFTEVEMSGIEIIGNSSLTQDISLNTVTPVVVEVPANSDVQTMVMGGASFMEYEHPLLSAVSSEDFDEVKDLIAKGANVNAKDKNYGDSTALHAAVETGNAEIVKYLLDMGAKINARDKKRRTPLMSIDDDATPELVRMLLDHGAKVNAFDAEGDTALKFAAELENSEVLRVLLDAGARVNAQNKEGTTALMIAANNDCYDNVKALLEAGADVSLRDKDGDTALDLSTDEKIRDLLKSYNAKETEK
ncbi:MAG TPA: ankyrin repeat domain-containing protein [Pyrinomonadaceae bacterium]|jgi:hypothetical protein